MKVIENIFIGTIQQITAQKQFLWFKWTTGYRKNNGVIFGWKNGSYRVLGLSESIDIRELFDLNPPVE